MLWARTAGTVASSPIAQAHHVPYLTSYTYTLKTMNTVTVTDYSYDTTTALLTGATFIPAYGKSPTMVATMAGKFTESSVASPTGRIVWADEEGGLITLNSQAYASWKAGR